MPDERALAVPVALRGLLRGRELLGEATVELTDDSVVITTAANPAYSRDSTIAFPLEKIEGARWEDGQLALFLPGDDVVEMLGGKELADIATELSVRARTLPELTRPLRALGSRRGHLGAEHQRFYGVFLHARRGAAEASVLRAQLTALDAGRLAASLERVFREFAAMRYPRSAPDRRALEAELADAAVPLRSSLQRLERAAQAVRAGGDDTGFVLWRAWAAEVHATFEQADRCWLAALSALEAPVATDPPRWRRWLHLGALLLLAVPAVAPAQRRTLRVPGIPAESLLARGFDVVWHDGAASFVVADNVSGERLRAAGLIAAPVPTPSVVGGDRRDAPIAPTVYRSFDDPVRGVRAHLDSMARANVRVHVDSIGASVEGRPILAVKVGAREHASARPDVIIMATYHAREWAATEMALRLIRYLARPAPDARVDSLVRSRDIWIIPVVNPDGYEYTFTTDRLWRKNRRILPSDQFGPVAGVDLNRNHGAHWAFDNQGSSPTPRSETYRGPSPASEPETQVIESFHREHAPVVSISYHTFTGLILYPPGYQYGLLPQEISTYRALAGTDVHPAALDQLPGSNRTYYRPGPSWSLYTTNGEYNDWAYGELGTLSFTPELTSGFEGTTYYGFEFPDDEGKLEIMFQDNLPFALDVIESARDPLRHRSQATGLRPEHILVESVTPRLRVIVPSADAATARVDANGPVPVVMQASDGGTLSRRLVSASEIGVRPARLSVLAGAVTVQYALLAATGAESDDAEWIARDFHRDAGGIAGTREWRGESGGGLRSPPIPVPTDVDTVSVLFWTRYNGDGFSLAPRGELRLSSNNGATWRVMGIVAGSAPVYYPERVVLAGVAGMTLHLEFQPRALTWRLDEIVVLAHGRASGSASPVAALTVSENPVRGDRVRFGWPFGMESGELAIYDWAGRRVWHRAVAAGGGSVDPWDVGSSGIGNGVYLAVARAGNRVARRKLFVARRGAGGDQ